MSDVFSSILNLVNEMSPYLLLGFFVAGLLHSFVPSTFFSKYLAGHKFSSVINAALFGIPLPLCSCGVIPTAMSLRKEGAGKGATVSFLIATPQTGVDSIFATYSLMGLPFALVRPLAALITAILGGEFVNWVENDSTESELNRQTGKATHNSSLLDKIREALKFGFVDMMEDIGKWLVMGLIIAGVITVLVPDSFFAIFKDNTPMSMLLVLCISVPMYLCATGSIPIAVALMMKGLTPGAALVLLMAGPASNVASMLVIKKVLGDKTLLIYLSSIAVGAIACGFAIDYLLPRELFTNSLMMTDACCHKDASWINIISSIFLACLLFNVFVVRKFLFKGHECACEKCASNMQTFYITGMNCNHCKANAEKAIRCVSGVEDVVIDLQSGEANVSGENVDEEEVRKAIEGLGFGLK